MEKKEIRIYFNLEKESDKKVYDFLKSKRSVSSYIIDKINSEVYSENESFNMLLANKLQLIADALNKIDKFTPTKNIENDTIESDDNHNIKLLLNDNFDDDY